MVETTYNECIYSLREGIHWFDFRKASRHAVIEHLTQLEHLYKTHTPEDVVPIIIDLRESGLPPMNHLARGLRDLNKRFPIQPHTIYAFIYKPGLIVSMASTFFNLLNAHTGQVGRFFPADKADDAIVWLNETVSLETVQ